jgi:MFS family permease
MKAEADIRREEITPAPEPWGMVVAGAILMAITAGVWYSASVFFVALLREFRQDYAFTAGIFSLFTFFYGISGLLVGVLVDRVGSRVIIVAGGVLLPLALAVNALAPGAGWLYFSHGILAALGLSAVGYVPVSVLLTRYFHRHRGLAIGSASAGVGMGILVLVPLAQLLIDRLGWRLAYVVLAAVSAAVVLPVALACLPGRDQTSAGTPRAPVPAAAGYSRRGARGETLLSAVCSREFWLVTATFTLINNPVQMVLTHQVAHLVEVGHPHLLVAGVVAVVGLVSVPGKMLWGYLSDRWWPELIYTIATACLVAGIAVLMMAGPEWSAARLYGYAVLMGLGYAVSPAMTPILSGRFFAGPHFGVIFGALNVLYHAGGAAGVWMAGYLHDATGGYRAAFAASICAAACGAACAWLAAPRRIKVAEGAAKPKLGGIVTGDR